MLAVDDAVLNGYLLKRVFRATATTPSMSGTSFVKRVIEMGKTPHFIMVTAYPEMMDILTSWKKGLVHGVVAKPWRPAELIRVVERVLAQR